MKMWRGLSRLYKQNQEEKMLLEEELDKVCALIKEVPKMEQDLNKEVTESLVAMKKSVEEFREKLINTYDKMYTEREGREEKLVKSLGKDLSQEITTKILEAFSNGTHKEISQNLKNSLSKENWEKIEKALAEHNMTSSELIFLFCQKSFLLDVTPEVQIKKEGRVGEKVENLKKERDPSKDALVQQMKRNLRERTDPEKWKKTIEALADQGMTVEEYIEKTINKKMMEKK